MGESADVDNTSTRLKADLKDTLPRRRKEDEKASFLISKIGPGHIKITSDRTKLLIESKGIIWLKKNLKKPKR
jgi:hypothetical protein